MSKSKLVPGEIVTCYAGILTDVVVESEQGPGELFISISTVSFSCSTIEFLADLCRPS